MTSLLLANHWPAPAALLVFAPWVIIAVAVFLHRQRADRKPR